MNFPPITLYRAPGACSLTPHILLQELGIPFKSVVMTYTVAGVAAADGSITAEEYKRDIHPQGYVAALQVDNTVITELPAIALTIISLARAHGKSELAADLDGGDDILRRGKCMEWLAWLSGTLHGAGYGAYLRPARYSVDKSEQALELVKAKGMLTIKDCYRLIEEKLKANVAAGGSEAHALGSKFTVVDVAMYNFWLWGPRNGIDMVKTYPGYTEVVRGVEKRDAVRRALEVEELPLKLS
ncbi:hypothetical protein K431DRAFT_282473 [Polychaeton citri CBS 116435]|uniref:Glutathione S-transferase n=1 Tax=Polychaeton citri CBS 116435 TaxID=1314669 RepID=A0A9P4URC4_9PEZI|nr:hypothetical protein K431DRAFT_282473 [Polychaeton citri CBS 116435]